MLSTLRWLGLEVKYLDPARAFYAGTLDLPVAAADDREVRLAAGDHQLRLRRPGEPPRGGLHTHFAFATPPERYGGWYERLSREFDLEEHTFGAARSLYLYDPDGNCVEIGQRELDRDGGSGSDAGGSGSDAGGSGSDAAGSAIGEGETAIDAGGSGSDDDPGAITGVFEVVLEVADLAAAEAFYADLGFGTVDRGADRRRVRMAGPVDLELWEPHLGLADARGGVHVDLGFGADDPRATADAVSDRACAVETLGDGVRIRDPDGHWLTVLG